jgi:thiamine-phosphate pyrophosphorylase
VTEAPHLYIITDRHATLGRPLPAVIAQALAGAERGIRAGARVAVQLREKDLEGRPLLQFARELRRLTADAGAGLFINDRVDVALAVGADGVHLGGRSLSPADVATIAPSLPVGISIHNPDQVAGAQRNTNVLFAVYGPVYPTPNKSPPTGISGSSGLSAATGHGLSLLALGSVDAEHIPECRLAGAVGVACIRAVVSATNPAEAVARLIISLGF